MNVHPIFAGNYPTGVLADVVLRRDVSSILMQAPDDIIFHHQINEASIVYKIRMAPGAFVSGSKLLSTIVVLHKLP